MRVSWFNGALIEGAIGVDPADRGLTHGDGVFETILVRKGQPIWFAEHLLRLREAAIELGVACDLVIIRDAVLAILQKSNSESEVLRITLTRGVVIARSLSGEGIAPSLLVTLAPFVAMEISAFTLVTSSIRRNETSPASRMKTLSYIDNILAAREVAALADDALMLNTQAHVACTTIGNLFLLTGNQLITPQLDQGVLPGVTRAKILHLASELRLQAVEAVVQPEDLLSADAVFCCNSLRLVTAVTKVDNRDVGQRSLVELKKLISERI
jgi:branched-chain amino acid aminotransferase